jgi:hypothetical protein
MLFISSGLIICFWTVDDVLEVAWWLAGVLAERVASAL